MNYDRFFAFGCSFTNYVWPTWADYLGLLVKEYYNYGSGGFGNTFIAHQILRANAFHKFNEKDLIIVAWSSPFRFDYQRDINSNWWETIMFKVSEIRSPVKNIERIISDEVLISFTVNNIYSTWLILHNLKLNYYFTNMHDYLDVNNLGSNNDLYPQFYNLKNANWLGSINSHNPPPFKKLTDYFDGKIEDSHPTPKNHLRFLENELYDRLSIPDDKRELLNQKMLKWQKIYDDPNMNSKEKFFNRFKETFRQIRVNNKFSEKFSVMNHYGGMA